MLKLGCRESGRPGSKTLEEVGDDDSTTASLPACHQVAQQASCVKCHTHSVTSTQFDHRVGLVCQRRTQARREPQCGGTPRKRRRRLRLARTQRPQGCRPDGVGVRVRSSPAGDRGRRARPHSFQAGDVRRRPLHGHLDRGICGTRGADRHLRGRRNRSGHGLSRRPLRDHRATRRARAVEFAAPHHGSRSGTAGTRAVGGVVRDRRQDHRRLPRSRRGV